MDKDTPFVNADAQIRSIYLYFYAEKDYRLEGSWSIVPQKPRTGDQVGLSYEHVLRVLKNLFRAY